MNVMQLVEAKDCEFLNYIKNYHGQSIVVYGAALGAERVTEYLKTQRISPAYVVVDREFYKEGMKLGPYEVKPLEDVLDNVRGKVDVIVAFGFFDAERLKPYEQVVDRVLDYEIFFGAVHLGELSYVPRHYYEEYAAELTIAYEALQDDLSKQIFLAYLNTRISGDRRFFEGLSQEGQYFEKELVDFDEQKLFIDCGGYDGMDTKRFFMLTSEKSASVIFEADADNMALTKKNLKEYDNRVRYVERGVWDRREELSFSSGHGPSSLIEVSGGGTKKLLCTSIDEELLTDPRKVTMIKMDIEGAEMKALDGAKGIIHRDRPVLAICVYHRPEDIFAIQRKIQEWNMDYKFYLRHYDPKHFLETVLYAV